MKLITCGAYHEAGHTVVAAVQGMSVSIHGVHVDRDGKGISYYDCRKPKPVRRGFDKKGERTIISLFAGLIAQQKFCADCPTTAASNDDDWIDRLLPQMYLGGTPASEVKLNEARQRFREEAGQLVNGHWNTIDALAKELLDKPFTPRLPGDWSLLSEEKTIDGARILAILKGFGICASISEK